MTRYVVLLSFTEKGLYAVGDSVARSVEFRAAAKSAGAEVEALYWTLGSYDGVLVLRAPDELTAAALTLALGRSGNVRTCMLRALDAKEFEAVVSKVH